MSSSGCCATGAVRLGEGSKCKSTWFRPQVCNLTLSKELHGISCRTSGLVGLWSCSLVVLPGTRFPCGMHGESDSTGQIARSLSSRSHLESAFDGFSRLCLKGLDCRGGVGWGWWRLPFANGEGRTGIAICPTTDAAPCVPQNGSGTRIQFWKYLRPLIFRRTCRAYLLLAKELRHFCDTHLKLDFRPRLCQARPRHN